MNSLRPWISIAVLFLITVSGSHSHVFSEQLPDTEPKKSESPAAEPTPDAPSEAPPKPAELLPEPEPALPQNDKTPPTGESDNPLTPKVPMDIDAQFEAPIEVNPSTTKPTEEIRKLFSGDQDPATRKPPEPEKKPEAPADPKILAEPNDPVYRLATDAIEVSSRRYLTAGVHTPWQIFHGLLGLRHDFQLKTQDGQKISALEWASNGASFRGESLFFKTPYGGMAHPYNVIYWFEGHPTQFMAYLTMCRLPVTHQFKTAKGEIITVADIINNAKMESVEDPMVEMTWTLWALAHYLPPDAEWTNKSGQAWSIERLVKIENASRVYDGPCGGTHNLFALSYARNSYLRGRRPLRGVWLEADQKIQRFIAEGRALQNQDGSFSTHYFKGPGYSQDFNTRITSSGHILEWLMVALPQSRLNEDWVQNGLRRLASDLIENRHLNAECGPLYHSIDALQIYRERMKLAPRLAQQQQKTTAQVSPGWRPAPRSQKSPSATWTKQAVESPLIRIDVRTVTQKPAPTKTSQPGAEIVIPKREKPVQAAEKLNDKSFR